MVDVMPARVKTQKLGKALAFAGITAVFNDPEYYKA
jgi:hypothetical protein